MGTFMSNAEKYEAFRNFMFNDLGVTKENLREWIREAVAQQVTHLTHQGSGSFDPKDLARKTVLQAVMDRYGDREAMRQLVSKEVAQMLADQFQVSIKITPKETNQ
ncbi:hypothetical protein F1188_16090 [Roseospira marina]|uniref:Uncharacterized protein n=1 Tax=Roseospira marina TaxID=140057 RepID=A0A5M6I807_9PROT|nr:hypothetical protein [Roseospira marina]KAA5604380.1 hypothetical protein F1188_16090 [Roseospira marina]MBB4315432.1 hypothetical protein [Roseospira marina]MBB5088422.1 hypothetical protein [Roseospira marina]